MGKMFNQRQVVGGLNSLLSILRQWDNMGWWCQVTFRCFINDPPKGVPCVVSCRIVLETAFQHGKALWTFFVHSNYSFQDPERYPHDRASRYPNCVAPTPPKKDEGSHLQIDPGICPHPMPSVTPIPKHPSITIRSPFLFHHSHHEYPFIPEIATSGRSCWWWWWWWWSWSWWSWCVLVAVLVLVLVLALGIVIVLVIVLFLLLVFVLALALALVVGYLLFFIVWCLLFDVVCCLLLIVGCWLWLWFWLWLLSLLLLFLWFWYELQPKFRWMESSIRDIFIFLEIELGLGKRSLIHSSKNDNICLYTKTWKTILHSSKIDDLELYTNIDRGPYGYGSREVMFGTSHFSGALNLSPYPYPFRYIYIHTVHKVLLLSVLLPFSTIIYTDIYYYYHHYNYDFCIYIYIYICCISPKP